jgi:acyl-CoA hydrolase
MMSAFKEYEKKLCSPEEAAGCVQSGNWVDYCMVKFPELLDRALARRRNELSDIKIRGGLTQTPYIAVVEADRKRETFTFNSWHFSSYERKLHDANLCNYIPMTFRYLPYFYRNHIHADVAFVAAAPMDENGFFSMGLSDAATRAIAENARIVIIEECEHYPQSLCEKPLHISEVDHVVRGVHSPLPDTLNKPPSAEELSIANQIVPMIGHGSALQLGIGGLPDTIGALIAESDIKDLGCHTEMIGDAYVKLQRAGKLTNAKKNIHRGKSVWTVAIGTNELYTWLDHNPDALSCAVDYTNAPEVIAAHENMVSINSALEVDLYGQMCAESVGARNISGAGGQLDFLTGAFLSPGGKGFICLTSTFVDKEGQMKSRIVPAISAGNIITDPRSQAFSIVTEYGAVSLAGSSTWERAEKMISIAHPAFRAELIHEADRMKIWRRTNKRI